MCREMFKKKDVTSLNFKELFSRLKQLKNCVFCECERDLVLHETENFFVVADPFPIYLGHLLIVSKDHYGDLGELPNDILNEFLQIKEAIHKFYILKYSTRGICYEHGRAGHCLPGENIECHHFHFHMIPIELDLFRALKANFYVVTDVAYSDIKPLHQEYGNYFLFESSSARVLFAVADDPLVPPHYIRTTITDSMGISNRARWTDYPDLQLLEQSLEAILS